MVRPHPAARLERGVVIPVGSLFQAQELLVTSEWIDLTPALRHGVYILKLRGEVVFVGRGRMPMESIVGHRSMIGAPPWAPHRGVRFDEVLLRPSHPDRSAAEVAALIAEFDPIGNRMPKPVPLPAPKVRRL